MLKQEVSPSSSSSFFVNLGELFETSRVQTSPQFLKVVLYFPVAAFLFFLRIVTGIFGFLLLSFLPRTSQKRSAILKGICKVFGLIVEVDDKYTDDSVKLLVANHVSLFDRLAVNMMVPCCTISKSFQAKNIDSLSFWKDTDLRYPKDLNNEEVYELQKYIEETPIRLLHFPECATTNGKTGLLKFHPAVFSLNVAIQPVLIHVSLSSFLTISPSILNSSPWTDGLWHFISPSTFFKLKTLPSMMKLPEESVVDFSNRVQQSMAFALNLTPTVYTSSDKLDFAKNFRTPTTASAPISVSSTSASGSLLSYQPSSSARIKHLPSAPLQKLTLSTAAENFGKTPKQRMASYQERKALLLQAARQKYLDKHCS